MFIETLFTIARTWKQPTCLSTDEWIKKWRKYIRWTHTRHKKERNNAVCRNKDAASNYHTEWSKSDKRERQILYDITHMCNLKYYTMEPIYETESGAQRIDWWLPRGRASRRGLGWEFGLSRCKLIYRERKNNRVERREL